jgi:hypothetical protein
VLLSLAFPGPETWVNPLVVIDLPRAKVPVAAEVVTLRGFDAGDTFPAAPTNHTSSLANTFVTPK